MHLMEAYTTLYELTRAEIHRRKLLEVIDVLWSRMFHAPTWTGIAQFALDFTPLPAIMFKTVWGSDRDNEGQPRPLNNTSYGHNIEFLWLFLHALDVLGESVGALAGEAGERWRGTPSPTASTRSTAGCSSKGPHDGPARDMQKEFWQQAESLVGLLDSYLLFRDKQYWDAFRKVFDFVWDHMINHEHGGMVRPPGPRRHGAMGLPRPRVEKQLPHHPLDGADPQAAETGRGAGTGTLGPSPPPSPPLVPLPAGGLPAGIGGHRGPGGSGRLQDRTVVPEAIQRFPDEAFDYMMTPGYRPLREQIALLGCTPGFKSARMTSSLPTGARRR